MLGAVIAEHAFDVLHATNKPNVEHENDDTRTMPSTTFQRSVLSSYSPTSTLAMNAGATMNKPTPKSRPSTIEIAISRLPKPPSSPSQVSTDSRAAAPGSTALGSTAPDSAALVSTTISRRCAQGVNCFVGVAEIIFPREVAGIVRSFFTGQNHRRFCHGFPCRTSVFSSPKLSQARESAASEGAILFMARTLFFIRAFVKRECLSASSTQEAFSAKRLLSKRPRFALASSAFARALPHRHKRASRQSRALYSPKSLHKRAAARTATGQ